MNLAAISVLPPGGHWEHALRYDTGFSGRYVKVCGRGALGLHVRSRPATESEPKHESGCGFLG